MTTHRNVIAALAFLALVSCGNSKLGTGVRFGTIICVKDKSCHLVQVASGEANAKGRGGTAWLAISSKELADELRAHVGKTVELRFDTYSRGLDCASGTNESCTSFRVIEESK